MQAKLYNTLALSNNTTATNLTTAANIKILEG